MSVLGAGLWGNGGPNVGVAFAMRGRIQASGIWTPARPSGSALWLRADLGVTLATGVAYWADQTGHQPPAAQSTGSMQPTVTASAINGKPALTFNAAASQYLTVPTFARPGGATAPGEAWILVNDSTSNTAIWNIGGSGALDAYIYSAQIWDDALSQTRTTVTPVVGYGTWTLYSVVSTATSWANYQNGALLTSAAGPFYPYWPTTISIGASGVTYPLTGSIAELWIGAQMSSADRASTKAYLTARYRITFSTAGGNWS